MLYWFSQLPTSEQLAILYLLSINVLTFFYYGIDKLKAHRSSRRISERTLWILALIGGSVGALGGMKFFRHKTKKMSFQAGIAVILAIQVVSIVFLLSN